MERFYRLPEIDSTNHFALSIIESGVAVHGTAIMADFQTAGKGQKGNRWESERGKNLLASFIFFPEFLKATELFKINQLVSVSICEVLEYHCKETFQIKWPNDILIRKRKIGGILIENAIRNGICQHSIIGIGINLNQLRFESYDPEAVSLSMITGKEMDDIGSFTLQLRDRIEYHFSRIQTNNNLADDLSMSYSRRMFGLNQWQTFLYEGKIQEGEITGIDESGQLMIRFRESSVVLRPKEIKFVIR